MTASPIASVRMFDPRCRCRLATFAALPTPSMIEPIIMLTDHPLLAPHRQARRCHRSIHCWHGHAARRSALPRERFSPLTLSRHFQPAHRVCSVHVSAARGSAAHVGGDQLKPSDKRQRHPLSGVLDRLSYLGEVRSGRSRNATCLGMLPRRALKRGTAKSRNARNLTGMKRFGE